MIKHYIKILLFVSLMPLSVSADPYFDEAAPSTLADHLHLSPLKRSIDNGWLPDLSGLPGKEQVAILTQHMIDVMMEETDPNCTSINPHLRKMIFQHFVIYQQMVNAQHSYFDEKIAHQWAHVLAMILEESSGDSTNITGMNGRTIATNDSSTDLQQWRKILDLSQYSPIKLNYQTNLAWLNSHQIDYPLHFN